MVNPNQIQLKIVVNGQPLDVTANLNQPLHVAIQHALQASGNSGQPLANWEIRDAGGQVLDPNQKIGELNLTSGTTLFLNLKAGVGGCNVRSVRRSLGF